MLYGRDEESAAVASLLAGVRCGRGGALAVRGEPGMGKTALLDAAAAGATDMRVLRVRGVQSEGRLSFAGLLTALRPVVSHLTSLPEPQAAALSGALGVVAAAGEPNRFLVAAGVLSLLADVAEEQPVLCLVDDAQWVDASSLEALLFAARRLAQDPVGMVFAARPGEADLAGVPELTLAPLDRKVAEDLVTHTAGAALRPGDRSRVVAAAAGNPLALVELSAELSASDGAVADQESLPLSARLEETFLHRVRQLPDDVQRLLTLAAADDTGELSVLLAAAESLGIDRGALGVAERARLLRLDHARVEFSHPLVRSAVYQAAAFTDRQTVHRALADADAVGDGEHASRRAWHRAAAAVFPDEDAADGLEHVAVVARARGGHDAAAAALSRAAGLTADPARRARLLLDAAEDAWESGSHDSAAALVDRAARVASGPWLLGRVDHLRGRLESRHGIMLDGYELLVAGADRLADLDPQRAAGMLVEAVMAATYAGDLARVTAAGQRAEKLLDVAAARPAAAFVAGAGAILDGRVARAAPLLREVVERSRHTEDPEELAWAAAAAVYLADADAAPALSARAMSRSRASGAVSTLPSLIEIVTVSEFQTSPAQAGADASEGLRLARETHQPGPAALHLSMLAVVAAIRGDEPAVVAHADEVAALAAKHGLGFPQARATFALAWLDLGLGRAERALERLDDGIGTAYPVLAPYSTPLLVEAAVRAGRQDRACQAVDSFEAFVAGFDTSWADAVLSRCRALVSDGDTASRHFEDALAAHASGGRSFARAKTQLLYGEHLRRERRRVEARRHLREALEVLDQLGAHPWAERAAAELRASGERARRRTGQADGGLTAQERQIARFVAAGASNKEVAAQLYLSPRTVDAHLRSVFTKLGITSRAQLHGVDLAG